MSGSYRKGASQRVRSNILPQRKAIIRPGQTGLWTGDSLTATYEWFRPLSNSIDTSNAANRRPAVTWVNSGVSGSGVTALASSNLNASVGSLVTAFNPDFVGILVGRNDAFGGATQGAFQAGLLSFATACLSARCPANQVLICSCWINGDPTGAIDALMDSYVVSARTVAAALGCPFVDVRTERPTDGGYTIGDGIHPSNPKGVNYLSGRAQAGFTGVIV